MITLRQLKQRGDTMVEVMICLAILGLMLVSAYTLTNRNRTTSQEAQERSQAVKISEEQLELLRSYTDLNKLPDKPYFCMGRNATGATFTEVSNPNAGCTSADSRYSYIVWSPAQAAAIGGNGSTYAVTVRWEGQITQNNEVKVFYAIFDSSNPAYATNTTPPTPAAECSNGKDDGDTEDALSDAADPGCSRGGVYNPALGSEVNPQCSNGRDDADPDDTLVDAADPGCSWPGPVYNADDDDETNPPCPATVSRTSYTFPAWHLYNTGGSKPTQSFTFTNPSNCGPLRINAATISNTTDFSIYSNGCYARTLATGASCTVYVQFYPPSGGGYNRQAYAGVKSATVSLTNTSGVASTSATMSGKAYTDRLLPGEELQRGQSIKVYNSDCYNNADACAFELRMNAGNGNIELIEWGTVKWTIDSGGNGYRFIMQTDGDLVLYNWWMQPVWYSWGQGSPFYYSGGDWLHFNNCSCGGSILVHKRWNDTPYFHYYPYPPGRFY